MIKKLRRRMVLLVLSTILLVTLGLVAAISVINYGGVARQAGQTLAALAANGGRRFSAPAGHRRDGAREGVTAGEADSAETDGQADPEPPENAEEDENDRNRRPDSQSRAEQRPRPWDVRPSDGRRFGGRFFVPLSDEETASLSNTFTAVLNEDGTVRAWESDRKNLWNEEEVHALCAEAASSGRESGRIGSRYYLRGTRGKQPILVVLDARLELRDAGRVVLITACVGAASCLILGIGAWLLVRRMTRPVEEAFVRQQRFVQDAGHEMKTPLAIISSHAQVLREEVGENESVDTILSEVQRTSGLVSQLLALSKLDREPGAARRAPFDLSGAALSAALSFESTAYEAGFLLETDAVESVAALGDEEMTRRLVLILMDNAVKYGDPGGPIRVSVRKKEKTALLAVENAGEDIPPEVIPHLFERFYRADAAHSRGKDGSGLGLAIAQELARAMGGRITCESGGGRTVFTLALPAK